MNKVAQLRKRLKFTQQRFAQETGLSYGAVQRYEQGGTPSPVARQAIAEVAARYGVGDLVDDWIADHADKKEVSIVPVVTEPAIPASPITAEDQPWVDMLLEILHSGHSVATHAVQENLHAFSRLVRVDAGKQQRPHPLTQAKERSR